MNWGLFLALAGFLLPLAHALRLIAMLALDRGRPLAVGAARLIILLLLCIPITGKLPAMLFAVTGRYGSLSELTETFLLTGWGYAHLGFTVATVVALDLWGGHVLAALAGERSQRFALDGRYLARDAAIAVVLLILAWAAAR